MSYRFILDEDVLCWDRIAAMDIEGHPIEGIRPTISITGIDNGAAGALL